MRFGNGSGLYKSVDGGLSFTRLNRGLPTVNIGRVGLDYYRADPRFVVAILETEKIANVPEDQPYAGLRAEDADVGAKITQVVENGPCEKAGLQEGDIVVSVGNELVLSYRDMIRELRQLRAGDTMKVTVSRDREELEFEIELAKRPETNGRNRGSDFSGTLGGQAANRQDEQGPDGYQYGGVYLSEDGGDSWKRINSLNPRPMYYSHIRFDPTDRRNIYVCGTSLYKSMDGGETFSGDGGTDGIHVDHHALWIDPADSRHMILGNDGGIYVTYDRMTHWSHHNNFSVGQFYHVGVDSTLNYKVYGGLQDNGSWGGPSRSASGQGIVNSDWFRVGGGDGFVTLVDENDPDLIYFESQNGGMGRNNLRTGEQGFFRPRAPRRSEIKYRFNWKTPFILSPHNSRIHYSAGNHVFRSFNRGEGNKRISPEITNLSSGSASALSESPVQAGVIYVGTTDGAGWMTEDGGNEWKPLFYQKVEEEPDEEDEPKKEIAQEAGPGEEPNEKGQGDEREGEPAEEMEESGESDPADSGGAVEEDPVTVCGRDFHCLTGSRKTARVSRSA